MTSMETKKTSKFNVWLSQVNYLYGESSLFLPYSVGMLEAYASAQKDIEEAFNFCGYIYRREPIDSVLARIEQSGGIDVFGISVYLWNEQYSVALGAAVRERYPECLIVIGGPQVPRQVPGGGVFTKFPSTDIAVFGEGEIAFSAILRAYAKFRRGVEPNGTIQYGNRHELFGSIAGLAIRSDGLGSSGEIRTGESERIVDLQELPSPYLAGCFEELLRLPYDWQACQETHRGCPYSCTFCDWGSATYSKVRQFPDMRIIEELAWFGQNKIRYLYNCDANYGLLARDTDLTRVVVETKKMYSFPKEFRACYAKNSNDRVFEIASMLNGAEMSKGVTLSFQSMDAHTQEIIRRKNIKLDHFKETLNRYRQAGIVTYTELILGLPGETYESFETGINTLLDAGQHDGINMYMCQVLPNSEMNNPAYREEHQIYSVRSPLLLQHSAPSTDPHQEYNDIVIRTENMDAEAWAESYKLAWAVQTFHCLGLSKFLAMFARHELGMTYSEFYSELLVYLSHNLESIIGQEYLAMCKVLDRGMRGGDWGQIDQRFGNVVWPTEEASFLSLVTEHKRVYGELKAFMRNLLSKRLYSIDSVLINTLMDYQQGMMVRPDDQDSYGVETSFNCHAYFLAILKGEPINLTRSDESLLIKPNKSYTSLEEYARLVVWYGRKGGRFIQPNVICYSKD